MEKIWLFYKYFYFQIYKFQVRNKRFNPKDDAFYLLSIFQSLLFMGFVRMLFPYDIETDKMKHLNFNIIGTILVGFVIFIGPLIITNIKVRKNLKDNLYEMFENNPQIPCRAFNYLIGLHFLVTLITFILAD